MVRHPSSSLVADLLDVRREIGTVGSHRPVRMNIADPAMYSRRILLLSTFFVECVVYVVGAVTCAIPRLAAVPTIINASR